MNKITKKILSLIMVMALALSMLITTSADDATCSLNDNEIGLLKKLAIVGESTNYSEKITRAELAYMVAKTVDAVNIVGSRDVSPFYDVTKEHKYYNEICAMVNMGVVSGFGNGYFRPDDIADCDAAYKMFACVLGYGFAEGRYSYIEMAKMAGILDGFKTSGKGLTKGEVMVLAYNTLHANVLVATEFSGDNAIATNSGTTALEHYFGYLRFSGVVTGANGTTLTAPDDKITKDEIILNNQRYECENGQIYLGKAVVVYVEKDQLEEYAAAPFYLYDDDEENEVFTVYAKDVIGLRGGTFYYRVGDKERKISVLADADVLYNDMAYPDYTDEDFAVTDGAIHFIDNNDDSNYDVIMIDSYYYASIEKADVEKGVVYCKYPENKKIGDENTDTIFSMMSEGRPMHFGSLNGGVVVAVKESKNTTGTKKVSFELINEMHNGKVSEISEQTISIGDMSFEVTEGMLTDETVRLGDAVNAYVLNGICAVILHEDGTSYIPGYLIAAEIEGGNFTETLKLQIIDHGRNKLTYVCDENLKIDGTSFKERIDDALDYLLNSATITNEDQKWPYAQFIRFVVGVDGNIKNIDTAFYDATKEAEDSLRLYEGPDSSSSTVRVEYWSASKSYHLADQTALQFVAKSSTKIFGIPDSYRDEDEWYLNSAPSNASSYSCEAYNVDPYSREADYIVIYRYPVRTTSKGNRPEIVTSVSQIVDENGEPAYKIETCSDTNRTKIVKPELMDTTIKEGDLIRSIGDYKGTIFALSKVFSAGGETLDEEDRLMESAPESSNAQPSMRVFYGSAVSLTGTHLVVTTSIASDAGGVANYENLNAFPITSSVKVYIYDSEDGKVRIGDVNDITTYSVSQFDCSEIFVCSYVNATEYIYVIK